MDSSETSVLPAIFELAIRDSGISKISFLETRKASSPPARYYSENQRSFAPLVDVLTSNVGGSPVPAFHASFLGLQCLAVVLLDNAGQFFVVLEERDMSRWKPT